MKRLLRAPPRHVVDVVVRGALVLLDLEPCLPDQSVQVKLVSHGAAALLMHNLILWRYCIGGDTLRRVIFWRGVASAHEKVRTERSTFVSVTH